MALFVSNKVNGTTTGMETVCQIGVCFIRRTCGGNESFAFSVHTIGLPFRLHIPLSCRQHVNTYVVIYGSSIGVPNKSLNTAERMSFMARCVLSEWSLAFGVNDMRVSLRRCTGSLM